MVTPIRILAAPLLCALIACQSAPHPTRDPAAARPPLLLLATTDFHGAIEGKKVKARDGTEVEIAGARTLAATTAAYRRYAESLGAVTVHVDAGDIFQGTLSSNLFEGKPVIELFNRMGVDAVALGNHDFDYGPSGPGSVPTQASDNARGALEERMTESLFPWLSGNLRGASGSFKDKLLSSHVVQKGNVRIGIIGLSGTDTLLTTDRRNLDGITFDELQSTVEREVTRLRRSGAPDYIIVVAHAGAGCKDNSPASIEDLSSCELDGGVIELAKRIRPGTVDAFVGGHTHRGVFKRINGAFVIQAFSGGSHLGAAWIGASSTALRSEQSGLTTVCSHQTLERGKPTCSATAIAKATAVTAVKIGGRIPLQPDPGLDEALESYLRAAREKAQEPLGVVAPRALAKSFRGETELGNAVVDLFQASLPSYDAVVFNNGGFRANLPAGRLVYNDLYSIFPFDSLLAEIELTGAELLRLIRVGISPIDGGLSWSQVEFSSRGCVVDAKINGVPINASRIYRILTTDFLASGGSGFDRARFQSVRMLIQTPIQRETTVTFLKANPTFLKEYRHRIRQKIEGDCPADQV